jgi:hypothetical protein
MIMRWKFPFLWLLLMAASNDAVVAQNAANRPPADSWVTNFVQFPAFVATNQLRASGFESLQAEAIAGKLKVTWRVAPTNPMSSATLFASAEDPGHWLARDWRAYPMSQRGGQWEAFLPVDSVDVPLAYFVQASATAQTSFSLMRICRPRGTGLEEPSRIFSPFLEGFEETLESWRAPGGTELRAGGAAKNGKAALLVKLPEGKSFQTIATTRVRGWQVEERGVTGVRLWLRAQSGAGRARFTFLANAYATNQIVGVHSLEAALDDQWQRVDLLFAGLPKFPIGELDLFSIEFLGDTAREFLVDDLSLLGRWKLAVE